MKLFVTICMWCLCISYNTHAQTDTLFMGVNVAGAEFGQTTFPGVIGTHYTYPSIQNIQYYASKNVRLLRLPFRWERLQPTLGGELQAEQLGHMNAFIDSCAAYNIKVILDMHNFGRYRIDTIEHIVNIGVVTRAHFIDVWKKIATAFKSKPNIYAYCLMNEPNDMGPNVWMFTAQEAILAIRSVDTKTQIHINGDRNSSAECWRVCSDDLKYLNDPANNLVFDAHVFFDKDGLGYYNSTSYDEAGADVFVGVKRIKPFIEWLQINNRKGFIGSFGVPYDDPRWVVALDTFVSYLKSMCINGCYWAGGPWWGDYKLSIEPFNNGNTKPQMQILQKYLYISPTCRPASTSTSFTAINTQIFIYPSPFKSNVIIDAGNCDLYNYYEVYDMTGRLVAKNKLQLYKNSIYLGQLQNGWYIIKLSGRGATYSQKILKSN